MENSPLKTVVVPAVFVSSVTFSAMTLPFALLKSDPVDVELPPFFKGEIQPLFDGEHNDKAISYVGFAIVASVAAGISSIEVMRRRIRNLPQPEAPRSSSDPSFSIKEVSEFERSSTANNALDRDDSENQISSEATEIDVDESIDFAALVQAFDSVQSIEVRLTPNSSLEHTVLEGNDTSQIPDSVQSELSCLSQRKLPTFDLNYDLNLADCYQTCRVWMPSLQQSLLAIIVNDRYYSLFRTEKTREGILEVIAKLGQSIDEKVVTKTDKGYTLWDLIPEAKQECL